MRASTYSVFDKLPDPVREFMVRRAAELIGFALCFIAIGGLLSLASWSALDPSLNYASNQPVDNWLGKPGAIAADLLMQTIGLGSLGLIFVILNWGLSLLAHRGFSM